MANETNKTATKFVMLWKYEYNYCMYHSSVESMRARRPARHAAALCALFSFYSAQVYFIHSALIAARIAIRSFLGNRNFYLLFHFLQWIR